MKNSQSHLDLLAHSSVVVEYLSQEFQNHDSNILYCPEIMLLSLSLFQIDDFRRLPAYGFAHAKFEKPNFSPKILDLVGDILMIFNVDLTRLLRLE